LKTTAGPTGDLGDATPMQIGAYATADQKPDVYNNVVNFIVLSNIEPPTPTKLYLQDVTSDICTTTPTTAYDIRDEQEYTIQKLADENCWILDNLRLGSDTDDIALTPDDTNISSDWTLPASISSGFNSYTAAQINTASKDTVNSDSSENWGVGSHKYGVYYNYCAATAGTFCYAKASGSGKPSYDICPSGWHLPGSSTQNEYSTLYTAYGSNFSAFVTALSLPLSGSYYVNSQRNMGYEGHYWIAGRVGTNAMVAAEVTESTFRGNGDTWNDRDVGNTIRCILKP
ncbi:hypothetical protein IJG27_01215, partial [Candidatus Saccharibacteria bacterium]|nr:hypothetical protein [Candidatus Saccharibacteria bacterium]